MKTVNDSFFDDLTTEHTQYILGYLCADGCVYTKPKKKISFTSKNKEILQKIQKAISTDYKVGFDGRGTYQLQIYSDRLYDRSIELGIPERKSLILKYPKWADRHFVRGYFDGDGTVYRIKNRPKALRCGVITGSRDFAVGLEKHLCLLGLKHHYRYDMVRGNKTYYRVCIHRKLDVLRMYDILYADATIYLLRKRNVFQKWLQKTLNIGENPEMDNTET